MSASPPEEVLKNFPDVYGHVIKREKKEITTIKGIKFEMKLYKTTLKGSGIRISLLDNTSEFFIKFNEFLTSCADKRPADEKALGMWSFTTLLSADPHLDEIPWKGAGFYIYANHIVFNEEEKSRPPIERLSLFIDYFKKKFGIKTCIREDEFAELDKLEQMTI